MEADRWRRVRELFDAALDQPTENRAAWLERACSDPDLRAEVNSLLAAESEDRVGRIVSGAVEATLGEVEDGLAGKVVGAYRIEHEIGRGGMGAVYLAERADGQFEQRVAIKVVRERLARPDLIERFRDERQILARLEHANIARLLDGGTTDEGSPFVVMEHIDGLPVDVYCERHGLAVRERLDLFLGICAAVSYAHRNLIVHRDLKPGNVLVTGDGLPKLLDFGVAKLLGEAGDGGDATRTVARMMTPEYASPEQIRGEPVSTASDVYSLGVMLYELLTGQRPYRVSGTSPAELESAICDQDPERPSTAVTRDTSASGGFRPAARELSGDLDNIVLMALRKEAARRYASAAELAEDIRRYLDGLPVQARPSTWSYRSGKFIRRHKLAVGLAAAAGLVLIGASVVSTALFLRADRAQAMAEQTNRFLTDMLGSVNPAVAQGQDVTVLRKLLDETATRIDNELTGQPEVSATLRGTIGSTYYSLGLYEQAEDHHRRGVQLATDAFGERDARTLEFVRWLSMDLRELSRYDESEELARRALSASRDRFGDDHLDTASNQHNLGSSLLARSQAVNAEPHILEALSIRRRLLGNDHPTVAETLLVLAQVVATPPIDDFERSERLLLEAQRIWRGAGNRFLFQLSGVAHSLGELRARDEQFDDAESAYRESLEIKRRILPENHPEIAVTINRLASMFEMSGDFDAAEPLYREALAIQRAVLDPDHRDLGTTTNNLAGTLRKIGRHAEADALYREAIEIYGRALGPEHPWVGIVLGSLAANHEANGDWVQCERVARECLRIRGMEWDADHWRNQTIESIRGACIAAQGRYAEGERILLASTPLVETGLGPEHASTRQAYGRIVALYETWGKPERAEPYRRSD